MVLIRKKILSFVITIVFLVYSVQPFTPAFMKEAAVLLPFIPIFFWLFHAPKGMQMGLLFLLGLVMDVLYVYPLGVNSLALMLLVGVVRICRERWSKERTWLWEIALFVLTLSGYVSLLTIFLIVDSGMDWDVQRDILRVGILLLLYVMCSPLLWLLRSYSD